MLALAQGCISIRVMCTFLALAAGTCRLASSLHGLARARGLECLGNRPWVACCGSLRSHRIEIHNVGVGADIGHLQREEEI